MLLSRKKFNRSAFSLMELLVVMAIMSMLTLASMPAFSGYLKGARLKGASRQIASAMRHARALAITNRKNYMVVFAIDAADTAKLYKAFKIYQFDDGTIEDWIYLPETIAIDNSGQSTILSDTYTMPFPDDSDSDGTNSVAKAEFKPNGGITQSRTIRVKSSVDATQFQEITYLNTTGRVKVFGVGEDQ